MAPAVAAESAHRPASWVDRMRRSIARSPPNHSENRLGPAMSFISSFLARTRKMPLPLDSLLTTALLALALLVAHPATVHAVDGRGANKPARPRICLVLSGGGARGAAHVGVLKVLEE